LIIGEQPVSSKLSLNLAPHSKYTSKLEEIKEEGPEGRGARVQASEDSEELGANPHKENHLEQTAVLSAQKETVIPSAKRQQDSEKPGYSHSQAKLQDLLREEGDKQNNSVSSCRESGNLPSS